MVRPWAKVLAFARVWELGELRVSLLADLRMRHTTWGGSAWGKMQPVVCACAGVLVCTCCSAGASASVCDW